MFGQQQPEAAVEQLTAEQVEARVRETMMAQQAQLLKIEGRNAIKLLQDEQKRAQLSLVNTINLEMETVQEHNAHEWKNAINKADFITMFQVEQLWK